jgi:predicted RNase H-like HicB family nuclease
MLNPNDYSVQISRLPDEGYIATSPEWPGLSAYGENQEGAIREMQTVLALAIEVSLEDGDTLPTPAEAAPVKLPSGRIHLRLARSLHGLVSERAKQDNVSINTLLVQLISAGIGTPAKAEAHAPVKERVQSGAVWNTSSEVTETRALSANTADRAPFVGRRLQQWDDLSPMTDTANFNIVVESPLALSAA